MNAMNAIQFTAAYAASVQAHQRQLLLGVLQVSLPVLQVDGCPVGLGLVGPKGSDEDLLTLAQQLYPALLTSDPL